MKLYLPILCMMILSGSMFATANGAIQDRYVIYRIDDIQSNWLPNVQITLLNQFIAHNHKVSLAVIPSETIGIGKVYKKVQQGVNRNLFEISVHGWKHVDYSKLDMGTQYKTITDGKKKLNQIFNYVPHVFIPPYDTFNKNTINVLIMTGFNVISSSVDEERGTEKLSNFRIDQLSLQMSSGNIFRIPAMISYMEMPKDKWIKTPINTIISKSDGFIKKYGYVVIVLHPQNFAMKDKHGNFIDVVNKKEMRDLMTLMNTLDQKDTQTIVFSDMVKMAWEHQTSKRDVLLGRNN